MLEKTFELHPEVCKYPQSALKHRRKMNLSFLVHWSARVSQADLLEKKIMKWKKLVELLKN